MSEDRIQSKIIGEVSFETNPTSTYDIVAVRRESGDVVAYQLSDGQVIDEATAVTMCNNGQLPGFMVSVSKFGEEFIRGKGDGDESNNLTNKPGF